MLGYSSVYAQDSMVFDVLNFDTLTALDSCNGLDSLSVELISNSEKKEQIELIIEERIPDRRKSWVFYVILFQLILVSTVKWFFPTNIITALKSFANLNLAAYQFREERGESSVFKILLNINFLLSLGLMSVNAIDYFEYNPPLKLFASFFLIVLFISFVFLLKYLQYLILAVVFPLIHISQFFQFIFFGLMRVLGVVLIPVNLVLYYSLQEIPSTLFYIAVNLLFVFFFFLIIKGLSISRSLIMNNKVHFFLYICTLEIVPAVLLVKFLSAFF